MQTLNPFLTVQAASVLARFHTSLARQCAAMGVTSEPGRESQTLSLGLEARADSLHLLFSSIKTRVIFIFHLFKLWKKSSY